MPRSVGMDPGIAAQYEMMSQDTAAAYAQQALLAPSWNKMVQQSEAKARNENLMGLAAQIYPNLIASAGGGLDLSDPQALQELLGTSG